MIPDRIRYTVGYINHGAAPMEFTLRYKGQLVSDGSPRAKHRIRQVLHPQLHNLWKCHPLLSGTTDIPLMGKVDGELVKATRVQWIGMDHKRGRFFCVPLVTTQLSLVCSLDIQFLRRDEPGRLIKHGGDIDNRLKTLFDALCVPKPDQIKNVKPQEEEEIFFCLLEDDALITGFCVETNRLLDPLGEGESIADVALNIGVKVSTTLALETEAFDRLKPVTGKAIQWEKEN
jgi:hypothetical protein